jgi:hypothetical protein
LGTYLGKTAPENPPVSLNLLFPEDSVSTDSDEDLAEELDEFFRFMIWNDLSGEEKKKIQILLRMESFKTLFLLRTSLLKLMILMSDDSDDYDDDGYLP